MCILLLYIAIICTSLFLVLFFYGVVFFQLKLLSLVLVFIPEINIDVKPDVSLSNTLQFIDLTTRYPVTLL